MTDWTLDIAGHEGPIYRAIATAIARDVARGVLRPGQRLPSQRDLAAAMGIDLTTVSRGFAEALRQGLIESDGRRGSFVRAPVAEPTPAGSGEAEPSGMNMPPAPDAVVEALRQGYQALLGEGAHLHYRPSGGGQADRAFAAAFLARTIGETSADQVLVTAGGQNALHSICATMFQPGDAVAAGACTYPGFLAVARRLAVDVVPLAMDEEGILPDALDAAARNGRLKSVYVVPTIDNPTTATMGAARRAAIVEVAARHGLQIIEDDAYGRLPEAPIAPIAAIAPERTWHILSLSKAVSPALRLALVRAPRVRDALRLAADVHETAVMAPPLNVALLGCWIGTGQLDRLVQAVRAESVARAEIAAAMLEGADFAIHPEGYHLWLRLGEGSKATDIALALQGAGLSAVPASAFAVTPAQAPEALRISLGGALSRDALRRGLGRLDALLAQGGRRDHALI